MMKKLTPALLSCVLAFTLAKTVNAADGEQFNRHLIGISFGETDFGSEKEGTYGLEYEYRINKLLGIGAGYEESPDAHHEDGVSVYLLSGYLHPYKGVRLGLGFGEEKVHGSHGTTENFTRVSIGYDFHFGNFGIGPTYCLDRVDDETNAVYGLTFSYGF